MDPSKVCEEFVSIIYAVLGSYLDATVALSRAVMDLEASQREFLAELRLSNPEIASMEYLDARALMYGKGPPSTHGASHRKTQGEFKALNRKGGENHVLIGNLFVAAIYNYWEDYYRDAIAGALGRTKNEIASDLFGDLRHLRTAIIHNRAVGTKETEQLKVLEPFRRGTPIVFTSEAFEHIVAEAISAVRSLVPDHPIRPSDGSR